MLCYATLGYDKLCHLMFCSVMWCYALAFIGFPGVLDILGFPDFPGVLGSLGSLGFESRRLDILGDPDFLRAPKLPNAMLCEAMPRYVMLLYTRLCYAMI